MTAPDPDVVVSIPVPADLYRELVHAHGGDTTTADQRLTAILLSRLDGWLTEWHATVGTMLAGAMERAHRPAQPDDLARLWERLAEEQRRHRDEGTPE